MRAVVLTAYGDPDVMQIREVPDPTPGRDEILVNVAYSALNRADLLQRMGMYPPPTGAAAGGGPGAVEIPGLEFSGTVAQVGDRVTRWRPGDRVFGLLDGGGYAEKVVLHEAMALPVPHSLTLAEAAGVAEVFLTAFDALVHRARFASGERVLVHAGGSGVGTAAIQLARRMGAERVFATVGTPAKAEGVAELGADAIQYKQEDFVAAIFQATGGRAGGANAIGHGGGGRAGGAGATDPGVDVVLDFIGRPYLARNMAVARELGRIVVIGLLGGAQADIDFNVLLRKRLTVVGTVLRSRTLTEKLVLTAEFARRILPLFTDGRLRPVIDSTFALGDVAAAHRHMAANKNFGKILLRVAP